MNEYLINIVEIQNWTYQYKIIAKSSEEALSLAESKHFEGLDSFDNWVNDSHILSTNIQEVKTK